MLLHIMQTTALTMLLHFKLRSLHKGCQHHYLALVPILHNLAFLVPHRQRP